MSKLHLFIVAAVAALFLWLFGAALVSDKTFSFRDAAHYYHPLFQWTRSEWAQGRVPLWNPYENIGTPLVAENTSSVFYPGQLIFALPLDYTLLYNVYVTAHVLLAAAGAFWLARHFGSSVVGAGVAGVSYAFSGNVLFQYCNCIFLVGAAWLPWGLLLADRALRLRRVWPSIGFGAVLALMTLGGDPQMAYNAVLLAAFDAMLLWRYARATPRPDSGQEQPAWYARRSVLLAISLATGGALAAVQILPSAEASRLNERQAYSSPRNVYELATYLASGQELEEGKRWYTGLLGPPTIGEHQANLYEFSVGPWRAIELLWPNISGRRFPSFNRWLSVLPAEGRLWVPSLYMGLMPVVLAALAWSVRRRAALEVRWLSWITLMSAIAAIGPFGLGWVCREVSIFWTGQRALPIGDEVGGIYWLMNVALPGYVYFRYPGKLWVVTALGISMLAAAGWDRERHTPSQWLRRGLISLGVLSVAGALGTLTLWPLASDRLATIRPDSVFGSFDPAGAQRDVLFAFLQTACVAVAWLGLNRASTRQDRQWPAIAALALLVLDLAVAQGWLVELAPADLWRQPSTFAEWAPPLSAGRLYRQAGPPAASWKMSASDARLAEVVGWERDTYYPRYALPDRRGSIETASTVLPLDYQIFLNVANGHGEELKGLLIPHQSVLDLLAVRLAILFAEQPPGGMAPAVSRADGAIACPQGNALPRAWVVHQIAVLPEIQDSAARAVERRTQEVLFPEGAARDWRRMAVVESDEPLAISPAESPAPAEEHCRLVVVEPNRVEIEVKLNAPGVVVLSDMFYPGWQLTVESQEKRRDAPILRTNRVMRGALLPAGEHRLTYRYRPASFFVGAGISLMTVLALSAAVCTAVVRRRGQRGGM